jgi:hypothetical protein
LPIAVCSWPCTGLALLLKSHEHKDSAPEPHLDPKGKTSGALASNIAVTQQGTVGAAQILDTPPLAIKPDESVSPGNARIWPQIDIQR